MFLTPVQIFFILSFGIVLGAVLGYYIGKDQTKEPRRAALANPQLNDERALIEAAKNAAKNKTAQTRDHIKTILQKIAQMDSIRITHLLSVAQDFHLASQQVARVNQAAQAQQQRR